MNTSKKILLAAGLALFAGVSAYSQATTVVPVPRPAAGFFANLPADLKALLVQAQANRVELRGFATALRADLAGKTEAERRAIIEQFRAAHSGLIGDQRDLARQIRTEMRQLRQQRRAGG